VLYGGVAAEQADVFHLFDAPLHPYTRALLDSMPRMGDNAPFHPIPGSSIQVVGDLTWCPFADRCPHVTEVCRSELPKARVIGDREVRCVTPLGVTV
jgi:peptide/nickel transport system ATP-binding protein